MSNKPSFKIYSSTYFKNNLGNKTNIKPIYKNLIKYMENIEETSINNCVILNQSNFSNGTFRIKKSGYYKLSEDIIFNPNPSLWNNGKLNGDDWNPTIIQTSGAEKALYPVAPFGPYHLGFFAAITIECDNVTLDLNNFTISQSIEHYLQQRFFSIIELGSSPFISGQGPSNFGNSVKFPNYIKIMNGSLGLSSHQAIHGNNMTNVILSNLNIFDYEQCGIGLNGGDTIILDSINIGKNSHNVFVNGSYSASRFIRPFLKSIIEKQNDPLIVIKGLEKSGTNILSELIQEMDSVYDDVINKKIKPTSSLFKNDSMIIDGSVYGLLLNVKGVAVNGFLESLDKTIGNKNIYINNLNITNLQSKPLEVIGLSVNNSDKSDINYGMLSQKGPVGDVFRIEDVIDENNYYNPNSLANAQCYVSKFGNSTVSSDIYDNWIIGNIDINTILTDYYFICGGDSMAHIMKGNIGLFLSGAQNIEVNNLIVRDISNIGNLGNSEKCYKAKPYEGNVSRGIAVICNRNLTIQNCEIDNISSKTANSIGIDFINKSNLISLKNCKVSNIVSATYLESGIYPNAKPVSYTIKNKDNIVN